MTIEEAFELEVEFVEGNANVNNYGQLEGVKCESLKFMANNYAELGCVCNQLNGWNRGRPNLIKGHVVSNLLLAIHGQREIYNEAKRIEVRKREPSEIEKEAIRLRNEEGVELLEERGATKAFIAVNARRVKNGKKTLTAKEFC